MQSKPNDYEKRVIKEFLLDQKLLDPKAVRNVMTSISLLSLNESLLSRDTQLDHYAKAIENFRDQCPQESGNEELATSLYPFEMKYHSESSIMKISPVKA